MASMELNRLLLHFCQCKRSEGKSGKTISWYQERLSGFIKYLNISDINPVLANLNLENARDFIVYEQTRGVSPFTVQGSTRALKVFSTWLYSEQYTEENELANLKMPKAPTRMIEPLTSEEIEKLVSTQNPLTALGSRNVAILMTLLGTGIRESELTNLDFEDAHIEQGYLKVLGKGSKERVVPVGGLGQKLLWRYVFHFRPDPMKFPYSSNTTTQHTYGCPSPSGCPLVIASAVPPSNSTRPAIRAETTATIRINFEILQRILYLL